MRKVTSFILLALLVPCVCGWPFATSSQSTIVHDVNLNVTKPTLGSKTDIAVTPGPFSPSGWLDEIVHTTRLHVNHSVVQYRFTEYMCRVMMGGTLDSSKYDPVCLDRNGNRHEDLFARWSKDTTTRHPTAGNKTSCLQTWITERIVVWEAHERARCASDILNGPHKIVHAHTGEKPTCDCKSGVCTKSEYSDKREQFWNETRNMLAYVTNDQESEDGEKFIIVVSGDARFDRANALSKMIAVQQNASKQHCSALLHFCRNAANGTSNVANLGDESYMAFCAIAKQYHEACSLRTCDKHDEYEKLVSIVENEHLRSRFRNWYVQTPFSLMFGADKLTMANGQDKQFLHKRQVPAAVWCFHNDAGYGSDNWSIKLDAYLELVTFGDNLFFKFVQFVHPSFHRLVDIAVFVLVVMAVVCYYVFRKWEDICEWALEALSAARVLPERIPKHRRLKNGNYATDRAKMNARKKSPGRSAHKPTPKSTKQHD